MIANSIKDEYLENGLLIKEIQEKKIIHNVREVIENSFNKETSYYLHLTKDKFQEIAVECQHRINELNIQKEFYLSEKYIYDQLFPNQELLFESVVFLRAVRPSKPSQSIEHPDMHRETFYSDQLHTPFVLNLWIPIKDVNADNTLHYIPKSHIIPDNDIKIEVDKKWPGKVDKFSNGHKLGFFWKPKKILSGVDLKNNKKMYFKDYEYSLFSSMLVHGGAENKSDKIRFAIGFGIIPKIRLSKNKSFFASNGQNHFIKIN